MGSHEDQDDGTATARRHDGPWCDPKSHDDDPANDCASAVEDTRGLLTHIAQTADGPRVYAEVRNMTPLVFTAAACAELAARFTYLAHLISR